MNYLKILSILYRSALVVCYNIINMEDNMDWQVIILTLGASLITGVVSLVGNIVVSKSNLKKTILESRETSKKEFMQKRIDSYNKILKKINYLELNINIGNILEKSFIEEEWLDCYPYCSKELNNRLHMLIKSFEKKEYSYKIASISNVRNQIKADLDEYYGIKDKEA